MFTWGSTVLLLPAFFLVLYSYSLRTRQLKGDEQVIINPADSIAAGDPVHVAAGNKGGTGE